jgi:hypothetical protein
VSKALNELMNAIGRLKAEGLSAQERAELTKRTQAKRYTGPAETPLSPTIISKRLSRMDHVPAGPPSKLAQIESQFEPFSNSGGGSGRKLKAVEEVKGRTAKVKAEPVVSADRVAELIAQIKAGKL